jgi:predicted amidophosphoribosyltransferase
VCCERPGSLVCDECLARIVPIDPVFSCTRCGAPFGRLLCTECQAGLDETSSDGEEVLDVPGVCLAACVFEGPPATIVRAYKDAGERRLGAWIAAALCDAAEHAAVRAPERYASLLSAEAIAFVPATAEAFRRRGHDHMELVARELSCRLGIPVLDCLVKLGAADQRDVGRAGRFAQALDTYRVVEDVAGVHLLLVDDVMTTGATMGAASRALAEAGASRIDRLAFARVW